IHSTPVALGSTTIGQTGLLALETTIPDVESGDHEIVVSAQAPGYSPATVANPVAVRTGKQLGEPETEETEDLPEKQVGGPGHPGLDAGGPGSGGHGFTDPSI